MNALKQWNRLKDLEAFQHALDSLLGRKPVSRTGNETGHPETVEWSPLVDISEDDTEYLIKAELADVKREDVKVTAEEGRLTIMGERKFETADKSRSYHLVERAFGTFGRSFSLPNDASPAGVSAEFKDGLLTVHLAKDGKAKPQLVEVKVA